MTTIKASQNPAHYGPFFAVRTLLVLAVYAVSIALRSASPAAAQQLAQSVGAFKYYVVTIAEAEGLNATLAACPISSLSFLFYINWLYDERRTRNVSEAAVLIMPPHYGVEWHWPVYEAYQHSQGDDKWLNYARIGPEVSDEGSMCRQAVLSVAMALWDQHSLNATQRIMVQDNTAVWKSGYDMPLHFYNSSRLIWACATNLDPLFRHGVDIALSPPVPMAHATPDAVNHVDTSLQLRHRPERLSSEPTAPTYFLTFKGTLNRHPIRQQLAQQYHNPAAGVVLVGSKDPTFDYADLIYNSAFALVPRGHVAYSYRFTEAVCAGAIPVLVADGWVPPFEELMPFDHYGVRVWENATDTLLLQLQPYNTTATLTRMRSNCIVFCSKHLATPDRQATTTIDVLQQRYHTLGAVVMTS